MRLAQPLPQVAASQAWQGPSKTGPATGYVSSCPPRGQPGLVAASSTPACFPRVRLGSVSLWALIWKTEDRQGAPPMPPSPLSYFQSATHSSTINMCALFTLSILINHNSRDICCQNCKLHLGQSLWTVYDTDQGCTGSDNMKEMVWVSHTFLQG